MVHLLQGVIGLLPYLLGHGLRLSRESVLGLHEGSLFLSAERLLEKHFVAIHVCFDGRSGKEARTVGGQHTSRRAMLFCFLVSHVANTLGDVLCELNRLYNNHLRKVQCLMNVVLPYLVSRLEFRIHNRDLTSRIERKTKVRNHDAACERVIHSPRAILNLISHPLPVQTRKIVNLHAATQHSPYARPLEPFLCPPRLVRTPFPSLPFDPLPT